MDKFYKYCSTFLIKNEKICSDDRELYEYAIKILIHAILNIAVTVLIGSFFGMLKECFCLLITFFVLRKFTGGIHAKKYLNCMINSIVLISISLVIIKLCINYNFSKQCFFGVIIISAIILILLSPIENQNKPLSKKEKKVYKLISSILTLINLVLMLFLIYVKSSMVYAFGVGQVLTTVLLIFGYAIKFYKQKGHKI